MMKVDLNSDLGESFGAYTLGCDPLVIAQMSSVNIACGYHAGDPTVMKKTVALVKEVGIAAGAHPSYPDMQGFGRRNMNLSVEEIFDCVLYQMGSLYAFLRAAHLPLQHVKPHGALYNAAASDMKIALAIGRAIRSFDASVIYCGLAGSKMKDAALELGLRFCSEVFADRGYMPDGTLVPRNQNGAMIHDENIAAERVLQMVKFGTVADIDGNSITIKADTICLHGDNVHAVAFAETLHSRLLSEGVDIMVMDSLV